MTTLSKRVLTPQEIHDLSSEYIREGLAQDVWDIVSVEVEGESLVAVVRMRSWYVSRTDAGGFHLTAFTALQFCCQLAIVHLHVMAGCTRKTKEVWLVDAAISCKRAIRDPEHIEVRLTATSLVKRSGRARVTFDCVVSDARGRFDLQLTVFMA